MRDLFTLGDEYANATETSEIFASVNGEVTATLAAEQAPLPELNHAEGLLRTHPDFYAERNQVQNLLQCMFAAHSTWIQCRAELGSTTASVYVCVYLFWLHCRFHSEVID